MLFILPCTKPRAEVTSNRKETGEAMREWIIVKVQPAAAASPSRIACSAGTGTGKKRKRKLEIE